MEQVNFKKVNSILFTVQAIILQITLQILVTLLTDRTCYAKHFTLRCDVQNINSEAYQTYSPYWISYLFFKAKISLPIGTKWLSWKYVSLIPVKVIGPFNCPMLILRSNSKLIFKNTRFSIHYRNMGGSDNSMRAVLNILLKPILSQ